jgi:hypothetical protein
MARSRDPRPLDRAGHVITFDRFWNIYPKRTDRLRAVAAWSELSSEEMVLACRDVEFRTVKGEWSNLDPGDIRYLPNPARYLAEHRWTDEREATEPLRRVPTVGGGKVTYAWDYETPEITEKQLAACDQAMAKLAEMVAAKTM